LRLLIAAGAIVSLREDAAMMLLAPEVLRALALVLCVWAVLFIGDGRRDR